MATRKSVIMWIIGMGVVLLLMAVCLNLDLFPVRLAY
jgi:hypothetical protein